MEDLVGLDRQHAISVESPDSPDHSPATSPTNTPTKRLVPSPAPSPAPSPSRVRCDSPVYIPLQDHQYALPSCSNNDPGDDPSLGMTGDVSARTNNPPERWRRPAPPPPPRSRAPQRAVRIRTSPRSSPYVPLRPQLEKPPIPGNAFPRARARSLF